MGTKEEKNLRQAPSDKIDFHSPAASQDVTEHQVGKSITKEPRNQSTTGKNGRWAYAFLIAGVDVADPGYLGNLYNVLVAADLLRDSRADVVVMVQMSIHSLSDRLTPREERWLAAMDVKVHYVATPPVQNFYTIQFEKFQILALTQYTRVIYLDGDVMPHCPMDYLFELSDPANAWPSFAAPPPLARLKENVVLSWIAEPAHGGFFMLAPKEGDYDLLRGLIARREKEFLSRVVAPNGTRLVDRDGLGDAAFDPVVGWGHVITPPDRWRSIGGKERNGTIWKWHGDFADQGLLYYWTKYYKKSVSLIIRDYVENWSARVTSYGATARNGTDDDDDGGGGDAFLEDTWKNSPLRPYSCMPDGRTKKGAYGHPRFKSRFTPHRDFHHFSGSGKPWWNNLDSDGDEDVDEDGDGGRRRPPRIDLTRLHGPDDASTAKEFWFWKLKSVDARLGMGLNLTHLDVPRANLGAAPTRGMLWRAVRPRVA